MYLRPVLQDETVAEVKARAEAKLGVPSEEFKRWKVAIVASPAFSSPRPRYLKDGTKERECVCDVTRK
jgi:hypothetical protein